MPNRSSPERHRTDNGRRHRSPEHRSRSPEGRRKRSPEHRRERSPERRRHRSPEQQRHDRRSDRSPERRPSPARRRSRSPDYRNYERPREAERQALPYPPPHYQRPPSHYQQPPQGRADDSDEELRSKAENYADYRRLKRVKLWESQAMCIYHNTPSPSPDRVPADGDGGEDEDGVRTGGAVNGKDHSHGDKSTAAAAGAAAVAAAVAEAAGPDEGGGRQEAAADDAESEQAELDNEAIRAVNQEEADLFAQWLLDQKALATALEKARLEAEEANSVVGPQLPSHLTAAGRAAANYGGALLPGEGSAMAAYVQSGKRIPRRGEIALTAEQIERFEGMGYIMSGSRHSRMNAVRIRKENQIYTAEEKAALAMFNFEENKRKEAKILEDMKRLVDRTMGPEGPQPGSP